MRSEAFFQNRWIPTGGALLFLLFYLWPLFGWRIYVETFDNLDSTVVWMKILAESGKIFADSNAIIPNMMNGLPRLSYGNEFSALFWLYKLFGAETAFRINALLIHTVAYLSMYLFLKRYARFECAYREWIIVASALLFSVLPFWPGAGLTTSLLPLLTYILFNIRNGIERRWEWIVLIMIPFFSSFIFLLIFSIAFSWIVGVADMLIRKTFDHRLFFALAMVTLVAMITEYRLFFSLLNGEEFVSHRSEFNIYFSHTFREAHVYALKFFLDGWMEHQRSLMMPWLLPLVIIAMVLSLFQRTFTEKESMLIWLIVLLSFLADFWQYVLTNKYTLLWVLVLSISVIFKASKPFKILGWLVLIIVLMSIYNGLCFYEGLSVLTEWFPILKQFNISRAAFIQPILWYIALAFGFALYAKKMKFFGLFLAIVVFFQFYYATEVRRFSLVKKFKYMTFDSYYAPGLFAKIKDDIGKPQRSYRVISYGIEPAVSLYNGFYTVDGYSTNYPLSYKHIIRKVQEKECLVGSPGNRKMFDAWGSKAYLLCIETRPENYRYFKDNNITTVPLRASVQGLCDIGTDYILSAHRLRLVKNQPIDLLGRYEDNASTPWRIWLYRMNCEKN